MGSNFRAQSRPAGLPMGRQFVLAAAALLATSFAIFADEELLTPQQLAAKIDQHLPSRWAVEEIQPAPTASDSEFVRRVYLDLIGRIPRVAETREFLSDPSPDKRAQLIDRLMKNAQFVTHWSNTWRDIILPAGGNQQASFFASNLRNWIEQQIRKDTAYDKMVRDLLAAPMNAGAQQPRQLAAQPNQTSPLAFFQAQEFKAENLAASTARVFLGVRLECAQCHDHPFA